MQLSALIVKSVALIPVADIDYSLAISTVSGAAPGQLFRALNRMPKPAWISPLRAR